MTETCSRSLAVSLQNKDLPRFAIVSEKPYLKRLILAVLLAWVILAVAWGWLAWRDFSSNGAQLRTELAMATKQQEALIKENSRLQQELAIAKRADFISRSANNLVQESLAEKDEQIAGLKADLDFYERLVGSGARRQGLNVHAASFEPGTAGAWQYTVTLTQNINRGGMTSGQMEFTIEGVAGGKLKTLTWDDLNQKTGVPGQSFSFRYFQALQGTVMLPPGFSPQRVKVSVKGSSGKTEHGFDWKQAKKESVNSTR
jgi:hypothetical protein